jgi:hypothetical protein
VSHATNAARLQCRVKPRKVGKFQGYCADFTTQQPRQLDDARVMHVDLAERDFAVQIECEDVFLTRPNYVLPSHNPDGLFFTQSCQPLKSFFFQFLFLAVQFRHPFGERLVAGRFELAAE